MKLPSLPLFTDTFSAETVHLSNEQVGMYIRLLCFAWTKKGKPFSTLSAERICQCINENCKETVKKLLQEFFINTEKIENDTIDTWVQKRISTEMNYLLDYYAKKSESGKRGVQAKRKFASSESKAPIPIPIPIPKNNTFDVFWNNLSIKRGSKKNAERSFRKICQDYDPIELSKLYNLHASKIQDKQFVPHVVTWLNGERFLDEDIKPIINEKKVLPKGVPEGSKECGAEGPYRTWRFPNGEIWNIHTFKDEKVKVS